MQITRFHMRLQDVLDSLNAHHILIVTGDKNAMLWDYERVMSNHGLAQRNDNRARLCEICDTNKLVIQEHCSHTKLIHKATWVSPDGKTRNQIGHVQY